VLVNWLLASLHLIALGVGLTAIWTRARALGLLAGPDTAAPGVFRRVFAADAAWGGAAILWIGTGLVRAFGGFEKGSAYYLQSHLFWSKMGLLLLVLLLEIGPMVTLIRWRIAIARQAEVNVRPAAVLARVSYIQAALVVVMVFVATAMSRGLGEPG